MPQPHRYGCCGTYLPLPRLPRLRMARTAALACRSFGKSSLYGVGHGASNTVVLYVMPTHRPGMTWVTVAFRFAFSWPEIDVSRSNVAVPLASMVKLPT